MSVSGWVFMVGFRVFDVALLAAWLFWFFRRVLDDNGEDDGGFRDGFGEPPSTEPPPASGLPRVRRLRDHASRPDRAAHGRPRVPTP